MQLARTMAHTVRVLTAGCNGTLPPLALVCGMLLMMCAMSRCKNIRSRCLLAVLLVMTFLPPQLVFSGDAGTPLLPQDDVSFLIYYRADHLGSSHLITEGNAKGGLHAGITYPRGTVLQRFEYGAWGGERFALNPNLSLDPRFTGQEYDLDTGLYFFKTRYYNPVLARFLQPDTVVPNLADPQAYNRYSYVRNNPLKYIDPTGHHYTEADDRMLNGDASDQTADEHFAAMHDPGYSKPSSDNGLIAETTNADENNYTGAFSPDMEESADMSVGTPALPIEPSHYDLARAEAIESTMSPWEVVGPSEITAIGKAVVGIGAGLLGRMLAKEVLEEAAINTSMRSATMSGEAVFWSGRNGANRVAAEAFARATGRKTLEMTPLGLELESKGVSFMNDPGAWVNASREFAKGASGKIHAFTGGARVGSVWTKKEFPLLIDNMNIESITIHDAMRPEYTKIIFPWRP